MIASPIWTCDGGGRRSAATLAGLLGKISGRRLGPIGGDFHQGSVFFDETNRPTFFNFDCAAGGAPMTSPSVQRQSMHARPSAPRRSFAGYFSVRPDRRGTRRRGPRS